MLVEMVFRVCCNEYRVKVVLEVAPFGQCKINQQLPSILEGEDLPKEFQNAI